MANNNHLPSPFNTAILHLMGLNLEKLLPLVELQCEYSDEFTHILHKENQKKSFSIPDDILSNDIGALFTQWRSMDTPPTLIELLSSAIDLFNFDVDTDLMTTTMAACILGEIPNANPYHNNDHFREVFYMVIRLCHHNNNLTKTPNDQLSNDDILLLLLCAAIHDFAHPGHGNVIKDEHFPSYVENRTLNKLQPFWSACGAPPSLIKHIGILIICTDVSRDQSGHSPASIAREIYLGHQHANLSAKNTPDKYAPLTQKKQLSLMSMILCEADIAMSSGLNYTFSKAMTHLIAMENDFLQPSPKTLHGFMTTICHGGYLTPAAQSLMGDAFQSILLDTEQDGIENNLYDNSLFV